MEEDVSCKGLILHRYEEPSDAFIFGSLSSYNRGSKGSLWWRDIASSNGWFGS